MEKSELAKLELPDVPGVYLFKAGRKVLYVGKATSLRDRVRSYFDDDLIATRGPRIVDMVTRADQLTFETTPTVLEALVREAALIKQYNPPANVDGKDDKTWLYAVITDEVVPRVLTVRGKDIDFKNRRTRSNLGPEPSRFDLVLDAIYGPFPSGPQLREGLRLLRRIFPFFDTPKPLDLVRGKPVSKSRHETARIEFNTQIKQYPREVDPKRYAATIRYTKLFLSGEVKKLRTTLERDMRALAKTEQFEEAAERRRELFALDHIQDVSLIKNDRQQGSTLDPNSQGRTLLPVRIEAYDTAHLAGTNAIGVMVVVVDGVPVKREYRTFRIRGMQKNDDLGSLKEILTRRLTHSEWPFPGVVVVDGGKPQKKLAETLFRDAGLEVEVVAVVKDERHRPREVLGARKAQVSEADAVLANAEAHRFSLARHRFARSRSLRAK